MKSKKKPNNAIFYGNYKELIYNGTPEQVKAIMTAFCQYAFDDITRDISREVSAYNGKADELSENTIKNQTHNTTTLPI